MKQIILLLLFSISVISAQELTQLRIVGKAEFLAGELISREHRDANGEVCAGFVVVSDLTGLTFKSWNDIVKMNQDPGRSFLFLSPSERVVEVYCFGYEPLKIYLNDIGVRLKSGEVWQVKVTGDKKLDVIPVTILIEPNDATIFLDSLHKGTNTTHQLSAGKHQLRVEKKGYKTAALDIDVSPSNVLFNVKLQEVELQAVQIKSEPSGATIYIDNAQKGETNKGIYLYPGTYKLQLTLAGYLDTEKEIEVKENENNIFSYTLEKNSGTLLLNIAPADATVKINGEEKSGRTFELKPGEYTLEISKSNYLPQTETVTIQRGEETEKDYTLLKNSGTLSLTVTPGDAEVLLNKENYSQRSSIELAPGKYKVEVKKTGYYDTTETIELQRGKTHTRNYTLRQKVGKLLFAVTPLEATIELQRNGQTINSWSGMKQLKDISVGEYELQCKASGYKTLKKKITIEENKTATVEIVLEKGSDIEEIAGMVFVQGGTYEM